MNNTQIAKQLETLADLLEFTGANSFRTRAYRNGARTIHQMPNAVADLVASGQDLTQLDGIGKGVAEKVEELIESGTISQMEEIFQDVPRSVLDLLNVPKLGPKKVAALFQQLGVTNLEELKTACENKQVRELSGFGAKTEESILAGIAIASQANERILWAEADEIVWAIREHMKICDAIRQMEFAGSYRRGKETVGDLDLLVDADEFDIVMDHFGKFPEVNDVVARGDTKMTVTLRSGLNVDLRVVPTASFGAALQYFTGSKEHNVAVRRLAKEKGLKVNEWGVFADSDPEVSVAGKDEPEVYRSLGLHWVPPELRENHGEIEQATSADFEPLIELSDIVGDLHMHTNETDGTATIEEMAEAAQALGLKYIAITDHSKRVTMARGLDADRLRRQWDEIDALNEWMPDDFVILKGIECDILEAGGMDLPDDVLEEADWVIASVHYGQNQPRKQITGRIIGAIENPNVSIVAHPTGRLINRREPYEVDMEAVMHAAKENRKLLELNASPRRLDLNEIHLSMAKKLNIPIVISTDAHHPDGLKTMRYGIVQARRGGLTRQDVANSRPWDWIREYLGR
ncbi:MAG: DNA polymerase/3'-5' exonuclease PolX [Pirellulaceae bacterium]